MAELRPIIPTDVTYTRTAIALHWLTVALIATGFTLGKWMVDLPIAPQTLRVIFKLAGLKVDEAYPG